MSKENIYKKALEDIAGASDQANPAHIKVVAQTALDSEPTTADEFNDKEPTTAFELIDEYNEYKIDRQSELSKYNKKLSAEAESVWRGTVLHPEYESPFAEEEE